MMKIEKRYLWASGEDMAKGPENIGLCQLALPILTESILRSLVSMVDVLFLSYLSDSVVSAVSIAGQYITLCQILCMAVSTGCIVCINQAIGMKNMKRVNRLATISVATIFVLGLLFGALFLFGSRMLLKIMSLQPDSVAAAETYMHIVGCMLIFTCIEITSNSLCRSLGRNNAPLIINVIENVINIAGNYLAVFHGAKIGMDALTGVALATVLSRVVGMCISLGIVWREGVRISVHHLVPFPVEDLKLTLSIGIPSGINNVAYSMGQLATTAVISMCGEIMVAAKTYVNNVMSYVALVGMAFGSASAIMVGYKIGAGEFKTAKMLRSMVTRFGIASNVLFTLIFICFRNRLLRMFTDDPEILRIGSMIIVIDLAVEIGRALNVTIGNALQAAGDVRYELIVNQLSSWGVAVGGSYLFAIVCGWGLYGVWIAFALDELLRGLLMLKRWRSDAWMEGAMLRRKVLEK